MSSPTDMSSPAVSKLFQPFKLGDLTLAHRIVLAPLTRFRAEAYTHVPFPNVKEYYAQRASTPGTLLISEATFISPQAGGYKHAPGIWSEEQISVWTEITDAIHAQGSFIYLQLWAHGRAASTKDLKEEDPSLEYVAPSAIKLSGHEDTPRALTIPEIKQYAQDYADAARNAVERAGFDGVEIHGANGYLIDQFLQEMSNSRTDEYGGSIENRSRFGLEVVDAVIKAVGPRKVGIRLSPWNNFQDMRMPDPIPQFSHFVTELKTHHPDLAYIHLVEPRVLGMTIRDESEIGKEEQNDFLRAIWASTSHDGGAPGTVISAGAYTRDLAMQVAEEKGDLIAVGRWFISNPDLPLRWRHNLPLEDYNRHSFYTMGDRTPLGYTDYPFAEKTPEQSRM